MIPLHSDDDDDIVPAWAEPLLDAAHARWLRFREAMTVAGRLVAQSGVAAFSGAYGALSRFLDARLFPLIVAYGKHRLHILFLVALGVLLMASGDPLLQLKGGNYTNLTGAIIACILLAQQTRHHAHQKASLDDLHAKVDALAARTAKRGQVQPPQRQQRPVSADAEEGAPR